MGIWDWWYSILNYLGLGNKSAKILFLGLDNAGKTTLLHLLKNDRLQVSHPTTHPTKEELIIGNIKFNAYDLGGHEQARRVWRDYFPLVDAIVFLCDTADPERLPESGKELGKLMAMDDLKKVPILILGNKIDKPTAVSEDMLKKYLVIEDSTTGKGKIPLMKDTRPLEVFMCSLVQKQGYGDGFRWLAQYL